MQNRKTVAHIAWTHDEVRFFLVHWPLHAQERVAFEVLNRSCAANGDAVMLGPNMVDNEGWPTYTRKKSDSTATAPFDDLIAPIWYGWTDDLERALAAQPKRHFTLLMHTNLGTPRSHKDATLRFSRVRNADDLPHLSSLGIRKYRAAIFKENGATSEQPMAI